MKKNILNLINFSIFILLIIIGTSCSKNDDKNCKICNEKKPDLVKDISLKIGAFNSINFSQTSIWFNKDHNNLPLADVRVSDNEYNQLVTSFNGNMASELMVLYLNESFIEEGQFNIQSVEAVSTYTADGNMLQHQLTKQNNGTFIVDKTFNIHAYGVSMGSAIAINEQFLKLPKSSILIIDRKPKKDFQTEVDVDVIRSIAFNYEYIKNGIEASASFQNNGESDIEQTIYKLLNDDGVTAPPDNCNAQCITQKNSTCIRNLQTMYPPSYRCFQKQSGGSGGGGNSCLGRETKFVLQENNTLTADSLNKSYNDALHYSFRDSILKRSSLGMRYVNIYYFMSDIYMTKMDVATALKSAKLLLLINEKLDKLSKPNIWGNDILLSAQDRDAIYGLCDQYQALYNDAYTTALISSLKTDLNILFTNKTVNQILTNF